MVQIVTSIVVDMSGFHASFDAMMKSLDALRVHVELGPRSLASFLTAARFVEHRSQPSFDFSELFFVETADLAARGASSFTVNAVDGYLALVTAVARDVDGDIRFLHGWPILSFGDRTPNVTEGRGGVDPSRLEAPSPTLTGRDTGGKSA